jgi:hypothetical protein
MNAPTLGGNLVPSQYGIQPSVALTISVAGEQMASSVVFCPTCCWPSIHTRRALPLPHDPPRPSTGNWEH